MAWNLTADFIETCSCNMLCPCWYGVRELMVMDQGWCASTWLLRVQQGQADGVNLGGRILAIALDFPGPTLYDGNGTARLYLDDGASADQRRELEAIFQGTKGGPMAILGGLVTTWAAHTDHADSDSGAGRDLVGDRHRVWPGAVAAADE